MGRKTPRCVSIAIGVFAIIQASIGIGMTTCCYLLDTKGKHNLSTFWSSIPLMLTGFIGLLVPFSRNQCLLTVYLIMNVFVTLVIVVCLCITLLSLQKFDIALHTTLGCHNYDEESCRCFTAGRDAILKGVKCNQISSVYILLKIITILGSFGGVSSLATCIFACAGLCCCNSQVSSQRIDNGDEKSSRVIHVQSGTDTLQSGTTSSSGGNHTLDSLPDNLEDMMSMTSLDEVHNNAHIIRFRPTEGICMKPPPPPPNKGFDPVVPSYVW